MGIFDGSWINQQGSILRLKSHGSFIFGSYQSGREPHQQFHVCGYGDPELRNEQEGHGLALSMMWRPISLNNSVNSISSCEVDLRNHWVSGYAGQIVCENQQDSVLRLNHCLFATAPNEVVSEIGAYLDLEQFERTDVVGASLVGIGNFRVSDHEDPINGSWRCQIEQSEWTIKLQLKDRVSGWLDGHLQMDDRQYVLQGFTDNVMETEGDRSQVQGLTVSVSLGDGNLLAFSGYLDEDHGSLVLFQQCSRGTAITSLDVQTRAQTCHFSRLGNNQT